MCYSFHSSFTLFGCRLRSSCTSHETNYMWGQSWVVNYGYSLTLAILWCELIPDVVNDYWDPDTTDIWDWVVAWDTLWGWLHWLPWWEFSSLFSAFLLFSYQLLFSPRTTFRFSGNCDRVSMLKINTRPASTSIFHLHFGVTCFFEIVTPEQVDELPNEPKPTNIIRPLPYEGYMIQRTKIQSCSTISGKEWITRAARVSCL